MATITGKDVVGHSRDLPQRSMMDNKWLKSKQWDLTFLVFSIVLVPVPYIVWILGSSSEAARQGVNLAITVAIGGPHMVATFSRTTLDSQFRSRYPAFIASSFLIPFVVIALALNSMPVLLTVFFLIASIHVVHQIVFITESYNRKERDPKYQLKVMDGTARYSWRDTLKSPSNMIDYLFVTTALYPMASRKVVDQNFSIGPTSLNEAIPSFLEQPWIMYVSGSIFAVAGSLFVAKSIIEYRNRSLNLPKFIFITLTAITLFVGPMMGNLDTAFQGINVWHSFQYLALTWYANRLRAEHGKLEHSPFFKRMSGEGKLKWFYGFNLLLTAGVGLIIVVVYLVLRFGVGGQYAAHENALEVSYYIGVLSILWQHYYHDHFLFTQTDALVP